jgi:hypothetical protein
MSQELVFFRYDILSRMRRRCLIPPRDSEFLGAGAGVSGAAPSQLLQPATQARADAMWGHLIMTLLQQSHLCPLPLLQQPIYWQYDHALQLYPLPHAVVVADSSPQAQHLHLGCHVFNPVITALPLHGPAEPPCVKPRRDPFADLMCHLPSTPFPFTTVQGSFADGCFAGYKPCSHEVEMNQMPRSGYTSTEYQYQDSPEEEQEEGGQGERGAVEVEEEAGEPSKRVRLEKMGTGREQEAEESADVGLVQDQEGSMQTAARRSLEQAGRGGGVFSGLQQQGERAQAAGRSMAASDDEGEPHGGQGARCVEAVE